MSNKRLRLFFWSSKIFENKPYENYGDLLSTYIVEQVSGRKTMFYNAPKARKKFLKKQYLMGIGSILRYATSKATVWGSGIIARDDTFGEATFCAVRGPLSRKRILDQGYSCPEVYGDPGLLLPRYYRPKVTKTYKIGVIPHYVDYQRAKELYGQREDINVVDLLSDDLFATTDHILQCENIISSSLHGLVIAHAYGIPAVWAPFSDKLSGDNTKYADYFMSVGIPPYDGKVMDEGLTLQQLEALCKEDIAMPKAEVIAAVQQQLIAAFPKAWMKAGSV